jgi:hypothetical protein
MELVTLIKNNEILELAKKGSKEKLHKDKTVLFDHLQLLVPLIFSWARYIKNKIGSRFDL